MSRNTEMPNLFVIGAAKCGTSSLHEYLDLHPEISMSDVKEPRYFIRHQVGLSQPVVGSRREYLALFEPGTKIRGEASVGYSSWPAVDGVPRAISDETENPRFIYLVRDPVETVLSGLTQMQSDSWFPEDSTGTAITVEDVLNSSDTPLESRVLRSVMFMTQLRQYLQVFPADTILILDSDELRNRRRETLAEVFSFLGVDPDFRHPRFGEEFNAGSDLRRKSGFYRSLVRVGWLRALVYRLPRGLRQRVIGAVSRPLSTPLPRVTATPEQRSQLKAILSPEVEDLREFTGKPFSSWSI
jgi:hypothetical protein